MAATWNFKLVGVSWFLLVVIISECPVKGQTIDDMISGELDRGLLSFLPRTSSRKFYLMQLDMILTAEQWKRIKAANKPKSNGTLSRQKIKGIKFRDTLWKEGKVPYEIIENDFDDSEKNLIYEAIDVWQTYTCVVFTNTKNLEKRRRSRIRFREPTQGGCSSYVGQLSENRAQDITLGQSCRTKPIIVHEIGHALGLYHEHMRPDRNDYVNINMENVRKGQTNNFDEMDETFLDVETVPYDLVSIMHYGKLFMSKNKTAKLYTIEPHDAEYLDKIGKAESASFTDIKMVNHMYTCAARCDSTITCPQNGFLGKDCRCFCPSNSDGTAVVDCRDRNRCEPPDVNGPYIYVHTQRMWEEVHPDEARIVEYTIIDVLCKGDTTYSLVGNLTCINGGWTGYLPDCISDSQEDRTCTVPSIDPATFDIWTPGLMKRITTTTGQFNADEKLLIFCWDNNRFIVTCLENGTWDMWGDQCLPRRCTAPKVDLEEYDFINDALQPVDWDTDEFCNDYSILVSCRTSSVNSTLVCMDTVWEGSIPDCKEHLGNAACVLTNLSSEAIQWLDPESNDELPYGGTIEHGEMVFAVCEVPDYSYYGDNNMNYENYGEYIFGAKQNITCVDGILNGYLPTACHDRNCTVPQSKMQYTSSRTALNGEVIVAFCPFDVPMYSSYEYDYTEDNITCIDGQFEGSWPSCKEIDTSCSNLQNGTVLYKNSRSIVTCDEGFALNVNEHSIECFDGALQTKKGKEVECVPDDCLVPANHEGRRIFQGIKKSEILEEQKVDHQNWVNISCSEPETEPAYRQFICVAGKWKWDGRTVWDTTKENDTFPECRAAVCSVPCKNEGVCIRDNVCDCPVGTQLPNCDADPCYIGNAPNMQNVIVSSHDVVHGPVKDGTSVLFYCINGYVFDSEEEHIIRTCSRGYIHIPECIELQMCQPPCQNGGRCINRQCQCSANTAGKACQTVNCPKPDGKHYVPQKSVYYPGDKIEAICCTGQNKCEVSRDECQNDGSWRLGGSCREDCFKVARNQPPDWISILWRYEKYRDTSSIISCFIACLANDRCQSVAFIHAKYDCYFFDATPNNSDFFKTQEQRYYQTAFC